MVASDYDHDVFAFAMLASQPESPFVVGRDGTVRVGGPLDFEAVPAYTLTVAVNETGNGRGCSLSDATTVSVSVWGTAPCLGVAKSPGSVLVAECAHSEGSG